MKTECPECRRTFDLSGTDEATEFFYGHDCEEPTNEETNKESNT